MDRVLSRVQVVGLESLLAVTITCSILIISRNIFTIWSRKFLHISLCYILAKNIANFWLTKRRPACSDRLDCLVVMFLRQTHGTIIRPLLLMVVLRILEI